MNKANKKYIHLDFTCQDIAEFFEKSSPKERTRFTEDAVLHYALTLGKRRVEEVIGRRLPTEHSISQATKNSKTARQKQKNTTGLKSKVSAEKPTGKESKTPVAPTENERNPGRVSPVLKALLGESILTN